MLFLIPSYGGAPDGLSTGHDEGSVIAWPGPSARATAQMYLRQQIPVVSGIVTLIEFTLPRVG